MDQPVSSVSDVCLSCRYLAPFRALSPSFLTEEELIELPLGAFRPFYMCVGGGGGGGPFLRARSRQFGRYRRLFRGLLISPGTDTYIAYDPRSYKAFLFFAALRVAVAFFRSKYQIAHLSPKEYILKPVLFSTLTHSGQSIRVENKKDTKRNRDWSLRTPTQTKSDKSGWPNLIMGGSEFPPRRKLV